MSILLSKAHFDLYESCTCELHVVLKVTLQAPLSNKDLDGRHSSVLQPFKYNNKVKTAGQDNMDRVNDRVW